MSLEMVISSARLPLPDRPAAYRVVVDCGVSDVLPPVGAQHLNGLTQDFCVTFATDQIKCGLTLSRSFGPGEHPAVGGNVIRRQPERLIEVGDGGNAISHLEQCFGAQRVTLRTRRRRNAASAIGVGKRFVFTTGCKSLDRETFERSIVRLIKYRAVFWHAPL